MGAGHTVTALFEVVPKGVEIEIPSVDPLEYQKTAQPIEASGNGEILHLKLRYKEPEGKHEPVTRNVQSGRKFY